MKLNQKRKMSKMAYEEFYKTVTELDMEWSVASVPSITDYIAQSIPGLNIIPRETVNPDLVKDDVKQAVASSIDDKINIILYPESILGKLPSVNQSREIAEDISQIKKNNTFVYYVRLTSDSKRKILWPKLSEILHRGYLINLETGMVEVHRKNTPTSSEIQQTNRPHYNDSLPHVSLNGQDIYFRACIDVLTHPVTKGVGIVSARALTFDEAFMTHITNSSAPIIVNDMLSFGTYVLEPDLPRIIYERI